MDEKIERNQTRYKKYVCKRLSNEKLYPLAKFHGKTHNLSGVIVNFRYLQYLKNNFEFDSHPNNFSGRIFVPKARKRQDRLFLVTSFKSFTFTCLSMKGLKCKFFNLFFTFDMRFFNSRLSLVMASISFSKTA